MKELDVVLRQVLVKQFYYRNAGFFLVAFFLLFGVQQPATFLVSPAFLGAVAASPVFTGLVLGGCFLYYLQCLHFSCKVLQAPENDFLVVACLLPEKALRKSLGKAHLQVFLPAVAYTVWLGVVGGATGNYLAFLLVFLYQVLLLWVTVVLLQKKLFGYAEASQKRSFRVLPTVPWPPSLWPIRYFLHEELLMFIFTKASSVAVLLGFMALYPYPEYDLRPTQVGFLMGLALHALLVLRMQEFQEVRLGSHRHLPYPLFRRMGQQLFLFLVLLVPEMFFLFRFSGASETLWPLAQLCLFGVSFLWGLYALLYRPGFVQDYYIRQVFFLFMGLLLLLLLGPPLVLVAGCLLAAGAWLYRKWYYRYERPAEKRET